MEDICFSERNFSKRNCHKNIGSTDKMKSPSCLKMGDEFIRASYSYMPPFVKTPKRTPRTPEAARIVMTPYL